MDRRSFITAAAIVPLAGSVGAGALAPETEIHRLYRDWEALTAKYNALVSSWKDREITPDTFESLVDPVLLRRDVVEKALLDADCEHVSDLLIKIKIADHFDWCIEDYNKSIMVSAQALAA